VLQMFDRIGMASARLDLATANDAERDLLRDFRVGLAVITLQGLKNQFSSAIGARVQELMSCLSEFYASTGPLTTLPPSLVDQLEVLAGLLKGMPQSEERLEGLVAVNGLRLDLGAAA